MKRDIQSNTVELVQAIQQEAEKSGNSGEKKYFSEKPDGEACSQRSQCTHNDGVEDCDGDEYRRRAFELAEKAKDDPAVYGGSEFTEAVRWIRENMPEVWMYELRPKIKAEKPGGVRLSDIDKATRPSIEEQGNQSVAADLVAFVSSRCELFYDEVTVDAFAAVTGEEGNEPLRIDSKGFTDWLSYAFYTDSGGCSASETALKQASYTIKGLCRYEGREQRVFTRTANYGGSYYLHIGDERNRVIQITAQGWDIVSQSPVKFWKPATAKPLVEPDPDGKIDLLWKYCNVPENERPLVIAWIFESWRPETPFPVLEITGIQGSAKSSTQAKLRQLIDPNGANLRPAPKTVEDIFVAARNNWAVSYENLSHLSPQMQDALCTLATGGGFATRTFFTNTDETVIEAKRPVIVNSIPGVVTAQDLTDRVISVELPAIQNRRLESDINREFQEDMPCILGGLLSLFVRTLQCLPKITIDNPPRMADFAKLGEAMMKAQGRPAGEFIKLYKANRQGAVQRSIESSPVAVALCEMAEKSRFEQVYNGTMQGLYDKLTTNYKRDGEGWPKSARGLSEILKRQLPALQTLGITIAMDRQRRRDGFHVTISKQGGNMVEPSNGSDYQENDLPEPF